MKIRDVMTRDVQVAHPDDTVMNVSRRMADGGFGFMPVAEADRLAGIITDRDLTIRALAFGASGSAPVSDFCRPMR